MSLKTAPGTQAIIDLEDRSPDVLFEAVDSEVPLWPQFRARVWSALNTMEYGMSRPSSGGTSRAAAWLHIGQSFLPTRWDAPRRARAARLGFLVDGGTVAPDGGRERNWLVGSFADANPADSAIVQWRPLPGRWGAPALEATWSMEPAWVRAEVAARLSRRDPDQRVSRVVEETLRHLDARMPDEAIRAIVAGAVARERARPFEEAAFERVIDRMRPGVVIMEDASYGSRATLVAMMKERGIVVAEPQHGWIGPTHAAYNVGAAMWEPPLRSTLPDHLLTFGDYWSEGLRFPGMVTPVGKPHLESAVKEFSVPYADRSEVLVASSTTDPDAMSTFVLSLRSRLPRGLEVVFRPHPSERASLADRYPSLRGVDGVRIDERADVYEALGAATAVIGVASTVLFEARAFGCSAFVIASPMTDFYVGDRFGPAIDESGLDEVVNQISSRGRTHAESTREDDLWAREPVKNFRAWLAEVSAR